MASEDYDFALPLPPPPPPAPARREAAISAAMRRFDADGDGALGAAAEPAPPRDRPRWVSADRPQLAMLVTAALVAVIGVPVAWLTISHNTGPATVLASRESADLRTFDIAEEAPSGDSATARRSQAVTPEPRAPAPTAGSALPPAQELAKNDAIPPPALAAQEAPRADADAASPTMAAPAPLAVPAPMASAPPAPPAMEQMVPSRKAEAGFAAADAGDSIVVTAARRRGRSAPDRGDWNACTVDDPERSLTACRYLIDPGAKGAKGQASSHLADGLSLAWQGETARAIAAFDRAIALTPKSSLAYLNRGLAYQRRGDIDRALADLDRAIGLAPGSARGYYSRSQLFRARGDARRADADQRRAIGLDPDYEEAFFR